MTFLRPIKINFIISHEHKKRKNIPCGTNYGTKDEKEAGSVPERYALCAALPVPQDVKYNKT